MDNASVAMDALRRIVRALRRADANSRGARGVSSAQLFVLRQLRHKSSLSISDLCRATLTSQSSVSEVVARLEANGLLHRTRATDDSRRAELSLTTAGRKVLDESPEPFQETLVSALHKLSQSNQQALASGMTAWLEEAGILDAPPTMFFEGEDSSNLKRAARSRSRQVK